MQPVTSGLNPKGFFFLLAWSGNKSYRVKSRYRIEFYFASLECLY